MQDFITFKSVSWLTLFYAFSYKVEPTTRLGSGKGGAAEIKSHKWFASIDWKQLEQTKITAPFVPAVKNAFDTSNFDTYDVKPPERPTQEYDYEGWQNIDDILGSTNIKLDEL